MKKETRVKDLPQILIDLIGKQLRVWRSENNAKSYLDKIDWQSVTDAERLAYCEVRYKEGDEFIPVEENCLGCKKSTITDPLGKGVLFYTFPEGIASNKNWVYKDGKFAEIIEEVESNPVEFKEGEMVEVKDISGLCLVVHVDGDMAWVIDENNRHYLPFLSDISKIDPDKELKEFAETIARKYVFGKHDALTDKQEVIDMTNDIVEAMKKVQSKK